MEAVGLVASVLTLAGVAKTAIDGLSFLEELRETQNDYRLLRRDIESIQAAAKLAERNSLLVGNPQSYEDQYTHQQLCRVKESLQEIVGDMQEIHAKCARNQDVRDPEAKKRKWIRYKNKLAEMRRRGHYIKADLIIIFQCDSATKLAAVARRLEMPAYSPADMMAHLEDLLSARGQWLVIAPNENAATTNPVDDDDSSLVTWDYTSSDTLSVGSTEDTEPEEIDQQKDSKQATAAEDTALVKKFQQNTSGCSKSCKCSCHGTQQFFQSSVWTRNLFGAWTGGYYKSSSPSRTNCGCNGTRPWWFEYETPLMLWTKALQIRISSNASTGLHFSLRPVRSLPISSKVWPIARKPLDDVRAMIQAGTVCYPDDHMEDGRELMEYAISQDNYDVADFLLTLWGGILSNGLSRRARYTANRKLLNSDHSLNEREKYVLGKVVSCIGENEPESEPSRILVAAQYGEDLDEVLRQQRDIGKVTPDSLDDLDGVGLAPLHYAAIRGDADAAQLLVDAGADPDVRDWLHQTPLMLAAAKNHVECMRVLLLARCSVNETGYSGRTALHLAAADARVDAIRLLLSQGAKSSARDFWGETPLQVLAEGGGASPEAAGEAVDMLLGAADVDMDAPGQYGRTVTAWAIVLNNLPLLRSLVSAGACLAMLDVNSAGILHLAASYANVDTLHFLNDQELSAKNGSIDLEPRNKRGKTVWDVFTFCLTGRAWQFDGPRHPSTKEVEAFVQLYDGIRNRNLQHAISVLEEALDALNQGDVSRAADLVGGLARLRADCHNHDVAGWYRGIQQEIHVQNREAAVKMEEDITSLKAELDHSPWDDLPL